MIFPARKIVSAILPPIFLVLFILQPVAVSLWASDTGWQLLDKGLELGVFRSPQSSDPGNSSIKVLRIDPEHYQFKLLNASVSSQANSYTAKEWCRRYGLLAAINASMYQTDYKTSVSLMRTKNHVNNAWVSKDMTILAFDRQSPDVPLIKIIDRQCEDFKFWKKKYATFVQSIRMISCTGENVWRPQPQKWSTVAIGSDHQGKILFIHAGAPYSTHDLINILKGLPLNIARAMYTEGGPQAQLYIGLGNRELEYVGNFEMDSGGKYDNIFSWPIPNVIGITRRAGSAE